MNAVGAELLQRVDALSLRDWVVIAAVVLLCSVLTWLALTLAGSLRATAASVRKIHQQQANIIGMMRKAGFRPANTLDWLDDADGTRQLGEPALTQFDWRKPE